METSEHSKEATSDQLTFLPADSPASHSVPLDSAEARRTTAISGLKCLELYGKRLPHGSSVRMLAAYLLGTEAWYSTKCSLAWKPKVTKSGRLLFQLAPSTPRTDVTEFGLLPTTAAADGTGGKRHKAGTYTATGQTTSGMKIQVSLQDRLQLLPTPTASNPNDGESLASWEARRQRNIAKGYNGNGQGTPLSIAVRMLPTPRAADGEKGTRSADGHAKERERRRNGTDLPTAVAHNGQTTGLKLQPAFALWMMGFPPDWCDLADGEMPPSRQRVTPSSPKSQSK